MSTEQWGNGYHQGYMDAVAGRPERKGLCAADTLEGFAKYVIAHEMIFNKEERRGCLFDLNDFRIGMMVNGHPQIVYSRVIADLVRIVNEKHPLGAYVTYVDGDEHRPLIVMHSLPNEFLLDIEKRNLRDADIYLKSITRLLVGD